MVLVLYTPQFVMKNGNNRAARHVVNFGSISPEFVVFFFTSTRKTRRVFLFGHGRGRGRVSCAVCRASEDGRASIDGAGR